MRWVDVRVRTPDWSFERWTNTDEEGSFAFSLPEVGDYMVELFLRDELQVDWEPPAPWEFNLASLDDQVTETLVLREPLRTKRVEGRVTYAADERGEEEGVSDARVFALIVDAELREELTRMATTSFISESASG